MEKVKRILALVGVILILALYGSTMFFAITDNSDSMSMFKASVIATIVIPVLLWAYSFIFKLVKKSNEPQEDESEDNN